MRSQAVRSPRATRGDLVVSAIVQSAIFQAFRKYSNLSVEHFLSNSHLRHGGNTVVSSTWISRTRYPDHRKGLSTTLAIAALTGATVVALTLPTVANAQPEPTPPPPPRRATRSCRARLRLPAPRRPRRGSQRATATAVPAPRRPRRPIPTRHRHRRPIPNAPPPPPADPNAPPPPPAPEPGRVDNAAGGFSYVVPAGWKVSDATQLSYGQALLTKIPPEGAQPPNDTSVLLGRLDLKLFAGAETDNTKAAQRLSSDMGEFFMPFPGTRINQETVPLNADGMYGCRVVLRGEVHRHQQAQRPDLGRRGRRAHTGGHTARPADTGAVVRRVARNR